MQDIVVYGKGRSYEHRRRCGARRVDQPKGSDGQCTRSWQATSQTIFCYFSEIRTRCQIHWLNQRRDGEGEGPIIAVKASECQLRNSSASCVELHGSDLNRLVACPKVWDVVDQTCMEAICDDIRVQ